VGDDTQAKVARRLNVSAQTLNNWEARGISQAGSLTAQETYGCNAVWIMSGKGQQMAGPSEALPEDSGWSDILGVRQPAALGDGQAADEYAETHKLKFRAESLRRKRLRADKLAVIYGKGDSMQPTINDGDAILIDTSDKTPRDGKLYVITYDGELLAKRLMELDGAWYAVSDNETDPKWRKPRKLDPSKGIEIAGRIRWVAGWVD
jgi:phage repressor protein C with HTH and peptisase S24 domain